MSRRSRDWSEGLAEDLREQEFAREFVRSLIEDGASLREALAVTIRAYGIKEFAEQVGLPAANISRAIREDYNPSERVLEQLLRPFGLRLAVTETGEEAA